MAGTVEGWLAEQRGVFTRAQAHANGYSNYQIKRRIGTGEWRVVFGGVLAGAGVTMTPRLRDRAAQLAVPTGVLVGPSSARRQGLGLNDPRTVIAVGRDTNVRLPGVRLLRERVPEPDLDLVDGLVVTRRARTVVDCLRLLDDRRATEFLDRALQAGWITPAELAGRVHGLAGRHGAARMARLSRLAGSGARSAAEREAVALLEQAGVGGWTANTEIWDDRGLIGIGDIVFERRRLVVEIDGRAHHVGPAEFQRDRTRQNRLVAAGWTVLRFTWRDLVDRPADVVAQIRAMLDRIPSG